MRRCKYPFKIPVTAKLSRTITKSHKYLEIAQKGRCSLGIGSFTFMVISRALYRECGQCTLSVARTPQVPLSPLHLILLLCGWPCSKPSPYAENSKSPPVLIYNPRGSLLLSTTLWTQVPQTWHPKPSSSYSLPSQPSLGIRPELVPKQWPYLSKWQKHPTHKNMTSFQSSDPLKAKPSPVPRPTWQAVSAHNPLAFATSSPGALSVLLCRLPHLAPWLCLGSSQLVPQSIRRKFIKCSVSASFSHGFPCCTTRTQGPRHSYL